MASIHKLSDRNAEYGDLFAALSGSSETAEKRQHGAALLTLLKAERSVPLSLMVYKVEGALMDGDYNLIMRYVDLIKRIITPENVHLNEFLDDLTQLDAHLKGQTQEVRNSLAVVHDDVEETIGLTIQSEDIQTQQCIQQLRGLLAHLEVLFEEQTSELEVHLQGFQSDDVLPEKRTKLNDLADLIVSKLKALMSDDTCEKRFEIATCVMQYPQLQEMTDETQNLYSQAHELFREFV